LLSFRVVPDDLNLTIAALLLDAAEVYKPSSRYWGYKNASRSIRRHPQFLSELTDKQILKIPGVGPATLRIAREVLDGGDSPTVARIVAGSGKAGEIAARRALRRNFLSAAMVQKVLAEPRRGAVRMEDYPAVSRCSAEATGRTPSRARERLHRRGYRCMCVTDHSTACRSPAA
jgi:hypothetical protein